MKNLITKDLIRVIIKDAGIDKTFLIKKAKGMASFDLFMDIVSIIERSQSPYANVAQQFMHNCMQTGISGKASTADVENLIRENSASIMYLIFNTFFRELNPVDRDNILEQIFKHVIFLNGSMETLITTSKNSNTAEHIDLYIEDIQSIFTICQEFIKLTFAHFLPTGDKIDSQEDLNRK
jgi:hypothetical protein